MVGGVHTIQSLTSIMKDFGAVEEVEMLGSKGNAALITFRDESSCKRCVDAYKTSDTMRATFVGRRKVDDTLHGSHDDVVDDGPTSRRGGSENLDERKLRQAAERERLMRQMELEDEGEGGASEVYQRSKPLPSKQPPAREKLSSSLFPPSFPDIPENKNLSPFELLEKYEREIFGRIDLIAKEDE